MIYADKKASPSN